MSECNRCGNDTHEDELKFNFGVCDGCDQNKVKKSSDRAFSTGWAVIKGCSCKPGIERDNCPSCEGTGNPIDFNALYHTCPKCGKKGSGIKYKHKKHGCSGVKMSDNEDDDRWRSDIEASEPMALETGWSVVKGKLQCNGREHIQLIEKDGVLMTDCECEKGCLPTKMTRA